MKKLSILAAAVVCAAATLTGCGLGTTSSSTNTASMGSSADLLGSLVGAAVGGNAGNVASTAVNAGTLISGIVGQLTSSTSASSIVGTWVYKEPSVQFESANLLAQAGGTVASSAIIAKIEPYYKKIGITPGKFSFTFNKDNTCSYTLSGKSYSGTYTYDASNHTITITGTLLTFPSAYVTVSSNNLAMTFDSTKLLTVAQGVASASQNATLSTLSSLSSSFNGMKTGFLFTKQ